MLRIVIAFLYMYIFSFTVTLQFWFFSCPTPNWMVLYVGAATPLARATNNVKKPQNQMCESSRKLDLRFLWNKTELFSVLVTQLILSFAIVQNKFQQTNKNDNDNDNDIKFEVSLHFGGSGLLCVTSLH